MKLLSKALLYYSLAVISIISLIGLVTSRNSQSVLINLLLFPVFIYLVLSVVRKDLVLDLSDKYMPLVISMIIVVGMFGLGLANLSSKGSVSNAQSTQPVNSNPIILTTGDQGNIHENKNETENSDHLVVKLDDPNSYVNIRAGSSTRSEVISQALPNQKFVVLSESEDFFEIELDGMNTGWISKDFVLKK